MNISILGSKAAGKSTQIAKLKEDINLVCFAPGEVFLDAARRGTPLGQLAQKYIGSSQLIPNEIVNGLVQEWLWKTSPSNGVVFDGYPRTLAQAAFLESVLKDMGRKLDAVIYLKISISTIIRRLSGRRTCKVCGDQFHVQSHPFYRCLYGRCQGEHLKPLEEDAPDSVVGLAENFFTDIAPLLEIYSQDRRLIVVDAEQEPECAHTELLDRLEQFV